MKIHLISALPLFVCLIFGLRGLIGVGGAPEPAEQAAQHRERGYQESDVASDQGDDRADRVLLARTAGDLSFSELIERLQIE